MGLRVNLGTLEKHVSLQTSCGQLRRGGEGSLQCTDMAQMARRARNLEKRQQCLCTNILGFWNSYNINVLQNMDVRIRLHAVEVKNKSILSAKLK